MYEEDSLCYLLNPQNKEQRQTTKNRREGWLEDHLYLPSHITFNQREEILQKYGKQALVVEKDVSLTNKLHFVISILNSFFFVN